MGLKAMLSKANSILKYPQTRSKRKLYNQWVKMADLPAEATTKDEVAEDIKAEPHKKQAGMPTLYILLLGIALLIFFAVLIILAVQSC